MKCLRPGWLHGLFLIRKLHSPSQPSLQFLELDCVLNIGLQGQFTGGETEAQRGEEPGQGLQW